MYSSVLVTEVKECILELSFCHFNDEFKVVLECWSSLLTIEMNAHLICERCERLSPYFMR